MDEWSEAEEQLKERIEKRQLLVFRLADEAYAVDVVLVEEVLEFTSVTRVPRTPEFLLGVVNVRGRVLPVMDLRVRLGLRVTEPTEDSRLIVVTLKCGEEEISVAAVADGVEGVIDLPVTAVEPAPQMGHAEDSAVSTLGHHEDRLLLILDTGQILTQELLDSSYAALTRANGRVAPLRNGKKADQT